MNMGSFLTGRVIWPASSTMQTSNLRFPNMACVIPRQVTPTTRALSTIASISRTFATAIPGIHYWGKKKKIWSSGYLLCCKDIWSNKLENKYKNTHKKKGASSQHIFGDFGGERERTWSIDHMAPKLWVNCISSPNTDKINILQNRRRICFPSAAV